MIEQEIYDNFSLICERLGLIRSKNIENYMREFIEKNKELLEKMKNEK